MAIEDYIPNIFGGAPVGYEGLLGADQSASLQKRANLGGLLGAVGALAQGMSPQGYRRSPLQNVLTALGAGFAGAGQTYESGLKNIISQQQLALQQRQVAGIQAMKQKYPDLADEFDTNPAGAFRIVAEREQATRKPVTIKEGEMLVSPKGDVIFSGAQKAKAEIINPDEAIALGLPEGAIYQRKPTGEIELVAGTAPKTKAKILSADEATQLGLPTSGNQKYQVDANGKIDLVQGTAIDKPATSIEEYKFYVDQGGKKTYEQFLKEKIPSTNINVMPAGTVPLGKEGANKVDAQLLELGQNRLNLQSISQNFKSKYLQKPFQLKMAAIAELEKYGKKPSPEQAAELAEYAEFAQNSYNQLNAYINFITGAAVGSGEEEARIRKGVPDPQKDSPTQFLSKLDAKIREGRLYEARLGYIKQNGLKMTDVDVNKIPTLMRQREAALKGNNKLFGGKNYSDKDPNHNAIVRAILSREFGLME
jgi:hypothetical protein